MSKRDVDRLDVERLGLVESERRVRHLSEEHLEDRVAAQVALRLQLGDEALERHVLMCEGVPHHTANLRK